MKTKYYQFLIPCALVLSITGFKAQVSSLYTFSQFQGSYTAISGGTAFSTAASDDQDFSDVLVPAGTNPPSTGPGLPIGFNFMFNNLLFDRVAVSNNGYIILGNSAQGSTAIQIQTSDYNRPISATSTSPFSNQHRISPLGNDLLGQPTSSIMLQTTGTAPNRTFVVQWNDYRRFTGVNAIGDTLNFQVRLYETTNIVDIVYGKIKSVTEDTVAQVGLRGGTNSDYNNRSVTGTLTWATSAAGTANNYFARYNSTVYPPGGLTYRWTPPQCSGTLAALTPTGLTLVCPGGTSTLTLINSYTVSGVTYTWLTSTSSTMGPFSPISNANDPSYITAPINQTTWYTAQATCIHSSNTTTSNVMEIQVAGTSFSNVPYFEGFEGILVNKQLPNCSWSVSSTTVCETYTAGASFNRAPKNGTRFGSFKAPTNPAGDYFYTNGIQLNAGVTYSAALNYITDGLSGWSEISILTGSLQLPSALVNIASNTPPTGNTYKLISNTFTVPVSGTYYAAVKCVAGSNPKYLSWDDLSITVPCQLNQISVSMSTNSQTLCTGQAVTLTATGADNYLWSNGATGSFIVVSPGSNSTFGVTGTSSLSGCSNNASQQLIVYQSPALSISANPDTICAGGSATLIAIGASSYLWSNGGNNYYTMVSPANTTTYSVIGFNSHCETTATTTIHAKPLPAVSASSSANALACKGDLITLTGNGANTYTWVSGNGPVNVVSPISFILSSTITYTLYGSGANGCENSAVITQSASACTDMGEAVSEQLHVYPNPTNGVLNLTVNTTSRYNLYDVTGRAITEGALPEGANSIDLTAYPAGMYHLYISSATSGQTVRIIKE